MASILSLAAFAAFTIVPAALGQTLEYSATAAASVIETIVIIWAATFAAESIKEARRTREAEFEPLFHTPLMYSARPKPLITIDLHNVGRGPALNARVHMWRMDDDHTEWIRKDTEAIPDVMPPGDSYLVRFTGAPPLWALAGIEGPQFLLELIYDDPLGNSRTVWRHYRHDAQKSDELIQVGQGKVDLRVGGKRAFLERELPKLLAPLRTEHPSVKFSVDVNGDRVSLTADGPKTLVAVRPLTEAAGEMVAQFHLLVRQEWGRGESSSAG